MTEPLFSTCWKSPSNIALVKYWGKKGHQIPANPSVSLTLSQSYSLTQLNVFQSSEDLEVEFFFEGKINLAFQHKVLEFIKRVLPELPSLRHKKLVFESQNSFPHSAGIASSASGMSALVLCLLEASSFFSGIILPHDTFFSSASYFARLASGSACRSLFGGAVWWGKSDILSVAQDTYAVPFPHLHPVFKTFHDDILIVSSKEKKVLSRAGHGLMDTHPWKNDRYIQANANIESLSTALTSGNLNLFGEIIENEALSLHSLMLSSTPPVILLQPNSLFIINEIISFREQTHTPVYFTIDAGPNIHLMYPHEAQQKVKAFVNEQLAVYCEANRVIQDWVGLGPEKSLYVPII